MSTVQTKDGDLEVKEAAGNGADDLLSDAPQPKPLNVVSGEISFVDHKGRTWVLRPGFDAVMEIEQALGTGVEALRTKFVMAEMPLAGIQNGSPTTHEYGVVIAAGIRSATGEARVDAAKAARLAYDTGRPKLRKPVVDFLWSLCNGGRGREEDLEKRGSSPSLNDDAGQVVDSLIQNLSNHRGDAS